MTASEFVLLLLLSLLLHFFFYIYLINTSLVLLSEAKKLFDISCYQLAGNVFDTFKGERNLRFRNEPRETR